MNLQDIFEMSPELRDWTKDQTEWITDKDTYVSLKTAKRLFSSVGNIISRSGVPIFILLNKRYLNCRAVIHATKQKTQEKVFQEVSYIGFHSKVSSILPNNLVNPIQVSRVYTDPDFEGEGIASYMYATLARIGFTVISDKIQYLGGKELWKKMAKEAHYLVPNLEDNTAEFAWIPNGFTANRKFFYTATMKYTSGSLGMSTPGLFGDGTPLYQKLPIDMIIAGEIVRPRIHLVDTAVLEGVNVEAQDVAAISAAFIEHRAILADQSGPSIAPKLLVVAKGSQHLNDVVNHATMKQLQKDSPNLIIFDISSAFSPRINGNIVRREEFLKRLQGLTDTDEAIIFHIRILAEGIDVPGITGIMPLNNLKKSAFLQTLGRATRLHNIDRVKLYANEMMSDELDKFIKPYAWVIIPMYGEIGSEIKETVTDIISELRTFGFNPFEDIFIRTSKGLIPVNPMDVTNPRESKTKAIREFIGEIINIIEDRDIADIRAQTHLTKEELAKKAPF